MLVDSHAHLDFPEYEGDREAVLARAREAGVVWILTVGISAASSRAAADLAGRHDGLLATAGIHPNEAGAASDADWETLGRLARGAAAVGECGLDYYRDRSPRDAQARGFRRQIALARELGKPLIVHCRDAFEDCLRIVTEDGPLPAGGVFHCFGGGAAEADRVVEAGFHVSFSGVVTFPRAATCLEAALRVPRERLLVETDSPFLSPHPHRGQRNEPARVRRVAEGLAAARGETLAEIAAVTTDNARALFGIPT